MTFRVWLRRFKNEDNAIGDLARDFARTQWDGHNTFPEIKTLRNTLRSFRNHLEDMTASQDALNTLASAWARYKKEIK